MNDPNPSDVTATGSLLVRIPTRSVGMTNHQIAVCLGFMVVCAAVLLLMGACILGSLSNLSESVDKLVTLAPVIATRIDNVAEHVDALRAPAKPNGPPRAVCPAKLSGAEHDLDLGPAGPCPNPDDGVCITWRGESITASAAEARCKAGKFSEGAQK